MIVSRGAARSTTVSYTAARRGVTRGRLIGFVRARGLPVLCPRVTCLSVYYRHSLFMIGANGSVRGEKEFEPSSLAAESESLLGPHLEDYWSHGGLLGPLWRTIGLVPPDRY